jgi:hypothetical protein
MAEYCTREESPVTMEATPVLSYSATVAIGMDGSDAVLMDSTASGDLPLPPIGVAVPRPAEPGCISPIRTAGVTVGPFGTLFSRRSSISSALQQFQMPLFPSRVIAQPTADGTYWCLLRMPVLTELPQRSCFGQRAKRSRLSD